MQYERIIRDYENPDLELTVRVPSLARRFPSLAGAEGLDPWVPDTFFSWLQGQGEASTAWHAGLFVLSLWGEGSWPAFDVVSAIGNWDQDHRNLFASWARSWNN